MLLTLLTVCFFGVISQSQGQLARRGACPAVTPLTNLDPSRIVGLWYTRKRIDNDLQRDHTCSQIEFTTNSNKSFTIHISGLIQPMGIDYSWKALGLPIKQPTFGAYQLINSKYAAQYGMTVEFLGTDYDQYAVMSSCDTKSGAYYRYAWILGRSSTVSTYMDQALSVLKKNNIPVNEEIDVDHTNCPN